MPNFINLKRFAKTRKVTLQRNEEKIEKGWAKTFMPDFIYLKRFAKTRKVTLQRNEEKILKKSKQKTFILRLEKKLLCPPLLKKRNQNFYTVYNQINFLSKHSQSSFLKN